MKFSWLEPPVWKCIVRGCTVFKGDYAQITTQLLDPHPMADTPVLDLNFALHGLGQSKLKPLGLDVRPLDHNIVSKIVGGLHRAISPNHPSTPQPN
jgi:hypothetical protein